MLDIWNFKFKGVVDVFCLFVVDLVLNEIEGILIFSEDVYYFDLYINDLWVDEKMNCIYMIDLVYVGLVVYNFDDNISYCILDNYKIIKVEVDVLSI